MSYKFISATDLFNTFEAIKAAKGLTNMAARNSTAGTNNLLNYLAIRDQVLLCCDINGLGSATVGDVVKINPITLAVGDVSVSAGFTQSRFPFISDESDYGLPNLIYTMATNDVAAAAKEFDPDTMTIGASPANWAATTLATSGGGGGAVNGGYTVAGIDNNFGACVFRGMTDGVPGGVWSPGNHLGGTELIGTNVYPGGLLMLKATTAKLNSGQIVDNAFIWVDIATGTVEGVAMPDLPGVTQTTIANFAEQPIFSNSFDWLCDQFIADVDSTRTAPKGEILVVMGTGGPGSISGSAFAFATFLRFVDFNPFNVPATGGAPTRVHGRVSQFNAVEFNAAPAFDVAGAATLITGNAGGCRPYFHRPSRRLFMFATSVASGSVNTAKQSFVASWARSIQATQNSAPVALDVPRTADITSFQTFVSDSLGQPVGGNIVNWSLFRNSTEGETLTISGGIGTTSTVAHGPIDTTAAGAAVLSITANGVALALTTDYTVVASTGVITWVTDQTGKTVLATYEHRATNATPAHGTLLTAQSSTDDTGRAIAQVKYADDDTLVGKLDRLIATFTP